MDTYMHIDSLHKTLTGSINGSMPGIFDIVGIGYHPPPPFKNTILLFFSKPPLQSANCPSPLPFRQFPPIYIFCELPP